MNLLVGATGINHRTRPVTQPLELINDRYCYLFEEVSLTGNPERSES